MLSLMATAGYAQGQTSGDSLAMLADRAFDERSQSRVSVSQTEIGDRLLTCTIRVADAGARNNGLTQFVLAAPMAEITTATVTIDELSSPSMDFAGQGEPVHVQQIDVMVKPLGYVRGNRLVRVQLPTKVPGTFGRQIRRGRLVLAFASDLKINGAGTPGDGFQEMVRSMVGNPDDVTRFAVPLETVPGPAGAETGPALGGYEDALARFTSSEDGFGAFTGKDLEACGLDIAAMRPTDITVWAEGVQQPVRTEAAAAERISPEDRFVVYTRENRSTYTVQQTYWIRRGNPKELTPAPGGGLATPGVSNAAAHFIARKVVQEDVPPVVTKNDQFLSILDYRWVWWTWTSAKDSPLPKPQNFQSARAFPFDLEGLVSSDAKAKLTLYFYIHHWTPKAPPISFDVNLNSKPLGQVTITDSNAAIHSLSVPVADLYPQGNAMTLTPQTTGTAELPDICFDRLEVDYPRSYTMTSSSLEFSGPALGGYRVDVIPPQTSATLLVADVRGDTPVLLASSSAGQPVPLNIAPGEGRRYAAVTPDGIRPLALRASGAPKANLRSGDQQADVVVIAWPEFMEDMKPWIERKEAAGHKVALVSVLDIYDQFGYGNLSPHAIREFLRYAAIHWKGTAAGSAASTVLLVGDSTSAYRNEFRNGVTNYVPTMRITNASDPFASDQWFVSYFGEDYFADAVIGRFSVNNKEDLKSIIRKQLNYETASPTGAWQNTLGFVADHSEFAPSLQRVMRQAVPPRFFIKSVLMDDLAWIDNYYFPKEVADARQAKVSQEATGKIQSLFDEGAAVITYFGHGSPNIWGNERMWFGGDSPNSDNLLLTNRDRLPLVINMTCNSGAIDYPQPRWNICISEDFMRVPNGGAVACFVPSGPGLTVQHERLMTEVGRQLFRQHPAPLGQSLQLAIWRYLAEENSVDLARMFILLGDPLLDLHVARPAGAMIAAGASTSQQVRLYSSVVQPGEITSGTAAIPKTMNEGIAAGISANADDLSASALQGARALPALKLLNWQQKKSEGHTAAPVLVFKFSNDSPLPARAISLQLTDENGKMIAESAGADVMPFSEMTYELEVPAAAGLTPLRAWLTGDGDRVEVKPEAPVAVTVLRSDEEKNRIAPAVVDPRSVDVSYRTVAEGTVVTVNAQVYSLAKEPLSNLRMALEKADGEIVTGSEVSVPPISPGGNTRVTLSAQVHSQSSEKLSLRLDPSGFYPEFARFPKLTVETGAPLYPDVRILSVTPETASPVDGQTIFLDVAVANAGKSRASGIKIEGATVTPEGEKPFVSQAYREMRLLNLDAGASDTVRLRLDPFRNAGENHLRVKVINTYNSPDANGADNSQDITLKVRKKADIRLVDVGVMRPRPEDLKVRQIRILAKVHNAGEDAAHGLKVSYYGSPKLTPANLLGVQDVDQVKAGETRDVILTYKMTAAEEDKGFNFTCEVTYRGSRQRTVSN